MLTPKRWRYHTVCRTVWCSAQSRREHVHCSERPYKKLQDRESDVCYMSAAGPLQPTPYVSCNASVLQCSFRLGRRLLQANLAEQMTTATVASSDRLVSLHKLAYDSPIQLI